MAVAGRALFTSFQVLLGLGISLSPPLGSVRSWPGPGKYLWWTNRSEGLFTVGQHNTVKADFDFHDFFHTSGLAGIVFRLFDAARGVGHIGEFHAYTFTEFFKAAAGAGGFNFGALKLPLRPKRSATTLAKGNTVEEPTAEMLSRAARAAGASRVKLEAQARAVSSFFTKNPLKGR